MSGQKKLNIKKSKKSKLKGRIPDEFIEFWDKDYYDLEESQRIKMTEIYVSLAEDYESGFIEKVNPPFFMTQKDIIEKEVKLKRQKVVEDGKEKKEILDKAVEKWQKESLIVLDRLEQLEVENYNLKIHIAETKMKEWEEKRKELVKKQEKLVEEFAEKYEISVEDYIIDPIKGVFVRNPELKFPYNLDNMPPK